MNLNDPITYWGQFKLKKKKIFEHLGCVSQVQRMIIKKRKV